MDTAKLAETVAQPTCSGGTILTDPHPDEPTTAPLFSGHSHGDGDATPTAHPNPVTANQFPVFLSADRPEPAQ